MTPEPTDISRLAYADLPQVIAIERRSFPTPWSLAMFVLELSKPGGICLAARRNGELVGYLVCSRYDTVWHVMNVSVDPGRRRSGIATVLLEDLLARVRDPDARYTLEVVDAGQRQPGGGRDALGRRDPDQQRADEPRALRDGHQLHDAQRGAGAPQRVVDDVVDQLEVVARGDLGHDAAVAVVDALRGDHVGRDRPVATHERRAGVVAAGLQRQDHRTGPALGTSSSEPASVAGVRHMIRASSPLSW